MLTRIDYHGIRATEFPSDKIFRIAGYPKSACDGCAIDLFYHSEVKETYSSVSMAGMMDMANSTVAELTTPKYDTGCLYIVFSGKDPVGIQKKYYNYFSQRYPTCVFLQDIKTGPIVVSSGGEVVGVVMPYALDENMVKEAVWYE